MARPGRAACLGGRAVTRPWIPYGRQSIDQADIEAVVEVLRGDWLTTGPAVEQFESALSDVVAASAVAVSSGTAALHAAYVAARVGPGDEVVTTPLTFVATAAAAIHLGATVRLADVEAGTLNLDPEKADGAITSRTKVITAVDYAGLPAKLDALKKLAHDHGALLLEDAAHSLGAMYRGQPVGSVSDLTTFSFHPVKIITTGEGGAVASRDPELVQRVQEFRNHGLVRDPNRFTAEDHPGPWHQEVHHLGLNYRLPDIPAALGTSQLKKLASFRARRSAIASHYLEMLGDLDNVLLPAVHPDVIHAWHLFVIRVDEAHRERLYRSLREDGIGTQVHYLPLHLQPALSHLGYRAGDLPQAEKAYKQMLSLPIFPGMTDAQVEWVVSRVRHHSG